MGDLTRSLPISQPAVSQHLRVLQAADLVDVRPEGNRRIYSLKEEGLTQLRSYVEGFWSDALTQFAAEAKRQSARAKER